MSTVIKSSTTGDCVGSVAFNFEDLTRQAEAYLQGVRAQAAQIIEDAKKSAEGIRKQAQIEGAKAAKLEHEMLVDQKVGGQMQTVLPALRQAIAQIEESKQAWLARWEHEAVRLAAAIAEKIMRRQLEQQPEISLGLIREALELAGSSGHARLLLNPVDRESLGAQIETLTREMGRLAPAEIVGDPSIEQGSCRVETNFGAIDQQWSAQLERIVEELS